jgi:hypothetical protein
MFRLHIIPGNFCPKKQGIHPSKRNAWLLWQLCSTSSHTSLDIISSSRPTTELSLTLRNAEHKRLAHAMGSGVATILRAKTIPDSPNRPGIWMYDLPKGEMLWNQTLTAPQEPRYTEPDNLTAELDLLS